MAVQVTWDSEGSSEIFERHAEIVRASGALAELLVYLSSLALDYAWNGDLAGARLLMAETETVAAVSESQLPLSGRCDCLRWKGGRPRPPH